LSSIELLVEFGFWQLSRSNVFLWDRTNDFPYSSKIVEVKNVEWTHFNKIKICSIDSILFKVLTNIQKCLEKLLFTHQTELKKIPTKKRFSLTRKKYFSKHFWTLVIKIQKNFLYIVVLRVKSVLRIKFVILHPVNPGILTKKTR
jgi:hypothetical protein